MPRLDAHHEIVKRALLKAHWTVTRDNFGITYKGFRVFIDLAAERFFTSDQEYNKITAEIKVFNKASFATEFERAIGQYSLYRFLMKKVGLVQDLYLAVAEDAYKEFFASPTVQEYIEEHQIYLLIFDHEKEELVRWIK